MATCGLSGYIRIESILLFDGFWEVGGHTFCYSGKEIVIGQGSRRVVVVRGLMLFGVRARSKD